MLKATNTHRTSKNGFTLLEVILVLGLSSLLLVSITSLFITSLTSRAKGNISKALKEEGTFALNQIEFMLRNAKFVQACEDVEEDPTRITFQSTDRSVTLLTTDTSGGNARIASNSALLTSSAVTLNNEFGSSSLRFTCDQAFDGTGQYVTVRFTLYKLGQGSTTRVSETFFGGAQIRNSTGTL